MSGGEAIEDLQHEGMERCDERDVGIAGQRVAHRKRPLRGQIEDEAVGQRLDALILGFLAAGSSEAPFAGFPLTDDTVGAVIASCDRMRHPPPSSHRSRRFRLARFVLGTHETGFDLELAVRAKRDEHTGDGLLVGIVDVRTIVDGIELGAEFIELLLDLLVRLLGLGIFGVELVVLGLQRIVAFDLLGAQFLAARHRCAACRRCGRRGS